MSNSTQKKQAALPGKQPGAAVPANPQTNGDAVTATPAPVTVDAGVTVANNDSAPHLADSPSSDPLAAAAEALAAEALPSPATPDGLAVIVNALSSTPAAGVVHPVKEAEPPSLDDALAPNARALRRVEHDGKIYGPGEDAGEHLSLNADQLVDLQTIGAVEPL